MKLSRIAFSVMVALAAGPVAALDLMEAYQAAQQQDAAYAAAKAAFAASKELAEQGRAQVLPEIGFRASISRNDNQYADKPTAPMFTSETYAISARMPLYNQARWASYSSGELQARMGEMQFKLAEQDLILRVAQAYFDVLMAQDSVQLAEAQKQAISEQLQQAKRNFEVGTATITDTLEAQARYDLVVAQELAARNALELRLRALQQIINAEPGNVQALAKELSLAPPNPDNIEKWVNDAQTGNPQVLLAQLATELADKQVSMAMSGHLPTLDAVGTLAKNKGNQFGMDYDMTAKSIGLELNIPLYTGGATQSRWRQAEAGRDKAAQDMENAKRGVAVQTRQAYLGVVNGMAQVRSLQQALKSSESLLESSKLGQSVGVRTNLDVLNAQQQLYATRRDLLQAQYNYLISQLRLKAAAGTLSAEDVAAVNRALR